jgi:hypothetical protein
VFAQQRKPAFQKITTVIGRKSCLLHKGQCPLSVSSVSLKVFGGRHGFKIQRIMKCMPSLRLESVL